MEVIVSVELMSRTVLKHHEQNTESKVRTKSKDNLNYLDLVQMNLDARDKLIPWSLPFAE